MRASLGNVTVGASPAPPDAGAAPGRRLSSHTDRSGTTVHGRQAVLVGALAGTPAVFLALVQLGALGPVRTSSGAPRWTLTVAALAFGAAGLAFLVHGLRGLRRARVARQLAAAFPREPWQWDHAWDRRGSRDRSWAEAARTGAFVLMAALLLSIPHWIMWHGELPLLFRGVVLLFDLVIVWAAWRTAYLIARAAKYRAATVRFRRFPLRPGEAAELTLVRTGPLAAIDRFAATLRCVQERYETRRTSNGTEQVVVCYELHAETQTVAADPRSASPELPMTFRLPADAPATALGARPPRYWELELRGEAPGVDYAGTFLVPVY